MGGGNPGSEWGGRWMNRRMGMDCESHNTAANKREKHQEDAGEVQTWFFQSLEVRRRLVLWHPASPPVSPATTFSELVHSRVPRGRGGRIHQGAAGLTLAFVSNSPTGHDFPSPPFPLAPGFGDENRRRPCISRANRPQLILPRRRRGPMETAHFPIDSLSHSLVLHHCVPAGRWLCCVYRILVRQTAYYCT